MTIAGWLQIATYCLVLLILTRPTGLYITRVMETGGSPLEPALGPLERLIYRLAGVDADKEMRWTGYALALLAFSMISMLFTYALLRLQGFLPLNPMGFSTPSAPAWATAMTADLAFNTAASFTTNTNWQSYSGEGTMSYLSQMLALALHNWVSAAAGMGAAMALIRGFARHSADTVGNFFRDLVRCSLYILFPICFIYTLFLVSQEAIKMLGINGGGFLNANSAHPFENPTPLSNFIEMLSIFILPAGLTYTVGKLVKDTRQGWALLAAMFALFLAGVAVCYHFEAAGNPLMARQGVEISTAGLGDLGGNMEGKEVRFGLANSALFATITTCASCGAVNCMHDSLTPMGGLVPLINIQLGEIVFGGVGSGLYGMLVFAVLTVFIAGLMVGRTPEYVGK